MQPQPILVVEDDPALVRLLTRYIERAGLPCLSATTIAEARTTLTRSPVGLLLVDLTLPDGSGVEFLAEALQNSLELRGILCSGYPRTLSLFPADLHPRVAILQKPFSPTDLLAMLA
jgi:two-component system, cell cycle sensor histidine kinase and response regulator CckA